MLRRLKALLRKPAHRLKKIVTNRHIRNFSVGKRSFRIYLGDESFSMAYTYPPGGDYEPWVRKYLQLVTEFTGDDKCAVDAGANMGIMSLCLGALLRRGTVYAFEPAQSMFQFLEKNLAANSISNVVAVQSALTAADDEDLKLNLAQDSAAGGSFISRANQKRTVPGTYSLPVPGVTLDSYLKALTPVPVIKIIKMDIEGWEHAALSGARETLKRDDPVTLLEFNVCERTMDVERRGAELFALIRSLFKYVFLINRYDQKLFRIHCYAELRISMLTGHFVEDLLCFNDPELFRHLAEEITPSKFSTYGAAWVRTIQDDKGVLAGLSQYPDDCSNGHDFGLFFHSTEPAEVRLTLHTMGPHEKNEVMLVHGDDVREEKLAGRPLQADFTLDPLHKNIIYVFAEKTFLARKYFGNTDPRELGVRIEVEEIKRRS